jgi:hypothetical protein
MSDQDKLQSLPSPVEVYKAADGGIREFLSAVVNLADSGVFCEPTCPICISKHRPQAEAKFTQDQEEKDFNKKCELVRKFFMARNEDVSISVIRNHFANHLNQGENELKKLEYVNKLATLSNTDRSTLDRLRVIMDALHERLISTVELDQELRGREIVAISKALNNVLELRAKIMGEMKGRGEVITIPLDKFNMTFEKALGKAKRKEEIDLVTSIMDDLSISDEK